MPNDSDSQFEAQPGTSGGISPRRSEEGPTGSHDPVEEPALSEAELRARSFVRGTGAVFQVVGIFLLFGACCIWPVSGASPNRATNGADAAPESASEPADFGRSSLGQPALPMVMLAITLVGGFACAACGVGLQAERGGSAGIASLVAGLQAMGLIAIGTFELTQGGFSLRVLLAGGLALLSVFLLLVAAESGKLMKRFPPPPDLGTATPEFMEEYRQKRLERLQNYDP